MLRIDNPKNPLFRAWQSLLSSSGIKKENAIILSGRKLVPEFLQLPQMRLRYLLVSDPKDVEKLAFHKNLEVIWLSKDLFDELDEAGTHFPLLIVDAPQIPPGDLSLPPFGLELVLALSNPLNLGAALRSAEAFGVTQVTLLKECAHPFLPKVLRSSSGSSLKLKLKYGPSITEITIPEAKQMIALDMVGKEITKAKIPENMRLFIGEEGRGVPKELPFQETVSIPINPGMDSLNAVAATSVALFMYRFRYPMKS